MTNNLITDLKKNKQAIFFVAKMLGLYLALQLFYDYYLSPNTSLDKNLIHLIISQVESILTWLGYDLLIPNPQYSSHLGIANTSGVVVGNPCDGLSLFILFASFLVIFQGKIWFKFLYISIGILAIHFLNVFRVLALALIVKYSPSSLDFHHSYTFTLFIYLVIFLLWMLRIKIFKKKGW